MEMEVTRFLNLTFQVWGVTICAIVLLCLHFTKRIRTRIHKLFVSMVWCNMGTMLMDIFAFLFRGRAGAIAWFGVRASNFLEFSLGNCLSYVFFLYLTAYIADATSIRVKNTFFTLSKILLGVAELALVLNLFCPFLYAINAQNIYGRLPLFPLMYTYIFAMLIVSVYILSKAFPKLQKRITISFLVYIFAPAIGLFVSAFVYGITFGYIGTSLALIVLFLNQQFEQSERYIQQSAEMEIEKLKENDRRINEGIKNAMMKVDSDENIQALLRFLGKELKSDRAYIFEKNDKDEDCNTYEWCSKNATPQIKNLQNLSSGICAPWYTSFSKNGEVVIPDIEEIKETEPIIYKILKPQGIKTLAAFPLHDDKAVIGFIGIDNVPISELNRARETMSIISSFVDVLLKKRNLVQKLRRLSYTDAATGAENRQSMYEMFHSLKNADNLGVMYCDLNGLKETNDKDGHSAGDKLIADTYHCIVKGFDRDHVFRIGGDEFVVLWANTNEAELAERTAIIRAAFREYRIHASIGVELLPHILDSIEEVLSGSEKKMYAEKALWYQQIGKERRANKT